MGTKAPSASGLTLGSAKNPIRAPGPPFACSGQGSGRSSCPEGTGRTPRFPHSGLRRGSYKAPDPRRPCVTLGLSWKSPISSAVASRAGRTVTSGNTTVKTLQIGHWIATVGLAQRGRKTKAPGVGAFGRASAQSVAPVVPRDACGRYLCRPRLRRPPVVAAFALIDHDRPQFRVAFEAAGVSACRRNRRSPGDTHGFSTSHSHGRGGRGSLQRQ